MITEYQIANFKAFGSPQTLPIRPITLIFGPNSSGKSSIFQSLLMLKQTIEDAPSPETRLLFKGALVDLGSYQECINQHDIKKVFSFQINFHPEALQEFLLNKPLNSIFKKLIDSIKYDAIGMRISFILSQNIKEILISKIELILGNDPEALLSYTSSDSDDRFWPSKINGRHDYWTNYLNIFNISKKNLEKILIDKAFSHFRQGPNFETIKSRILNLNNNKEKISFYCEQFIKKSYLDLEYFLPIKLFDEEIKNIIDKKNMFKNEECTIVLLILMTSQYYKKIFNEINYIGPLRMFPERYYTFSGSKTKNVGKSGEYFSDILITDRKILDKVNHWFWILDIGYELRLHPLSAPDFGIYEVYTLQLFNKSTKVHAGLTDVGFGLSQVLPVIVQSVASQEKTILIEQPEYHLHPRLQAELGDMFIESALGEQKNTFLIETHSEHLILRILRRIRETSEGKVRKGATPITPDQVSVVYVQPGPEGSEIIPLPITADGEFARPRPEGFFADRAQELM